MTTREIVKIKNGWTVVSSAENEGAYRYATRAKAEAHVRELERQERQTNETRAQSRVWRIEAAGRYLAARAARPKAEIQLNLF
jgi:hypothetical protein